MPIRIIRTVLHKLSTIRLKMDGRKYLRSHFLKTDIGLEIGPSYNPVSPKSQGYAVETVDWANQEGLINYYKANNVDINKIEAVDYVWNGQRLAEVIPTQNKYDYILASHCFEHTLDLIGVLQDCSKLLKDEGKLILALPDKRFCFDRFRTITSLARLIDAHFYYPQNRHTVGTEVENLMFAATFQNRQGWSSRLKTSVNEMKFIYSLDDAKQALRDVKRDNYIDRHSWVFTPASFQLVICDLKALDLIDLSVTEITGTRKHEFFVILKKNFSPLKSREELLKRVDKGC